MSIYQCFRKIYWLQSNPDLSFSLCRSELDGSQPLAIRSFKEKPLGIAVDMNSSRVYWITQKYVSSVLWDGSQNQTLKINIGMTAGGMVLFKDNLYICEIQTRLKVTVAAINKLTGKKTTINEALLKFCLDISVYHSSLQKGEKGFLGYLTMWLLTVFLQSYLK